MKEHIYILDDHPIIAEGLAKLLTLEEKYQITIGKHYSELYNYIDNQTPSLLIIDYELQDKTVLELLPDLFFEQRPVMRKLIAIRKHPVVIAVVDQPLFLHPPVKFFCQSRNHKTAHKKRSGRHRYQKR